MSIRSTIKSMRPMSSIDAQKSPYLVKRDNEGAPYLYYRDEEFVDLSGQQATFFQHGVFLDLKEHCKEYENSKFFRFFDNDKNEILHLDNWRSNPARNYTDCRSLPPTVDFEVQLLEDYIYVKEIDLETKNETEYLINVRTGEKLYDLTEGEQLSIDI